MPLSEEKIKEHHATLRIAVDPDSPFFGMIDFEDGLLSLSVEDQIEIYNSMPPELEMMVVNFKNEMRNRE